MRGMSIQYNQWTNKINYKSFYPGASRGRKYTEVWKRTSINIHNICIKASNGNQNTENRLWTKYSFKTFWVGLIFSKHHPTKAVLATINILCIICICTYNKEIIIHIVYKYWKPENRFCSTMVLAWVSHAMTLWHPYVTIPVSSSIPSQYSLTRGHMAVDVIEPGMVGAWPKQAKYGGDSWQRVQWFLERMAEKDNV